VRNIHLPIYNKERCTLFALGRNAIYAACIALGLKPGDEVLTPAFDCDGTLQPFRILNLKLQFFRCDAYTFACDIIDIKKRITPKIKLIHIINHFGLPQPWDELLLLRNETGIPILEDNAYSLFSRFNDTQFGAFGDISAFSLRKNLPLIDGGLLCINNPGYRFQQPYKDPPWFYPTEKNAVFAAAKKRLGYYKLPGTLRSFMRRFNPAINTPPPLFSESGKGYPAWRLRDRIGEEFLCDYLRPMSRLAKMQLSKFSKEDIEEIMDRKRRYYSWLSERLDSIKGIKILWPELPKGIIPFCFSFLVESRRDAFFEDLREKYDVMVWPTLSQLVLRQLEDFPEVELLGKRLLQINLPSDKVRLASFSLYLKDLIQEIRALSGKYLSPSAPASAAGREGQ